MSVPTGSEIAIYQSPLRTFEVKVQVEIDQTVFSGTWDDQFDDNVVDPTRWQQYLPSGWGSITEASGYVEIDGGVIPCDRNADPNCTDEGVPYPPYMVSRNAAGAEFPTQEADFVLSARISFPEVTAYGVQFRVVGLTTTIFEVEENSDYGLNVKMGRRPGDPNYPPDWTASPPLDTGWHVYRLEYTAATKTYVGKVDGVTVVTKVIDELPITIVIGNSAVNQGYPGFWTKIRVDYVTVTGTPESTTPPAWATPFTEDGITWSFLPTVLSGSINIDKENNTDTLQVTALNSDNNALGIYEGTNFHGKRIRVKSRVGDGTSWANWRWRFRGKIDNAEFRANAGESELILSARDEPRYALYKTFLVKSYGDYSVDVSGIVNHLSAKQIIEDLCLNEALLSASQLSLGTEATGNLTPKTFNVVDTSAGDAVRTLCESIQWMQYVQPSDGVLVCAEWYWADGQAVEYVIGSDKEIERVGWTKDAFNAVGQSMVSIQHTSGYDIALGWPANPIPAGGTISRMYSQAGQSWSDLEDNAIPYKRWRYENRTIGSIEVLMTCQNWVEHNQRLGVNDSIYLGTDPTKVYIVDGWNESFSGDDYTITVRLIDPDPMTIIQQGIVG